MKSFHILGLFLISVLSLSIFAENFEEALAKKASGVETRKFGYQTQDLVCGDILCKEVDSGRTVPHVAQTVAFESVAGKTILKGIEGLGEPQEPTIVLRTGFVMLLTVINQDEFSHMLHVEGLDKTTKALWPDGRQTIVLYSEKEGEFDLVDVSSQQTVGKLRVVKVEPGLPQIPKIPRMEAPPFTIPELPMTPTIPIPKYPEIPTPEIRVPLLPEIGLPSFPQITLPDIPSISIPTMRVSAPGSLQASVAFEKIEDELKVVGIEGTADINPTLVTRTGYLYTLTVTNHDTEPHSFVVGGTAIHSGVLKPSEGAVLAILPDEEAEFSYYDGVTGQVFGKLKIVTVEPTFP